MKLASRFKKREKGRSFFHPEQLGLLNSTCHPRGCGSPTVFLLQKVTHARQGPVSDALCCAPVQAQIMDMTYLHRLPPHLYSCKESSYSHALASDLSVENARGLLRGLPRGRNLRPAVSSIQQCSGTASRVVKWLARRAKRLTTFRSTQTPTPQAESSRGLVNRRSACSTPKL